MMRMKAYLFYISRYLQIFSIFVGTLTFACSNQNDSLNRMPLKFLALGDSYTIGEAVEEHERWPMQLRSLLSKQGVEIEKPEIIATTGWTTDELLARLHAQKPVYSSYELVSLLIGVNNQYRGYPISIYEQEFEKLLQIAISYAGGEPKRVLVLSIPDYGVTPFAQTKDPVRIGQEIDAHNQIALQICQRYDVSFFNITDVSRQAAQQPDLLAKDRLHPSGKMYAQWAEIVLDEALKKVNL